MTGLNRTTLTTSQKVEFAANALAELLRTYWDNISKDTPFVDAPVMMEVGEEQIRRAIVALRTMAPNAIRPIGDRLPVLYPVVKVSYGKTQSITAQAESRLFRDNGVVRPTASCSSRASAAGRFSSEPQTTRTQSECCRLAINAA